jgi:hypothetical protein
MDYLELIARVISHIPDKGQVMVRYYGLYANAHRGKVRKAGPNGVPPEDRRGGGLPHALPGLGRDDPQGLCALSWPLPWPTRPKIRRRQPGRLDFEMLTSVRGRDILLFVMGRVDPEVAAGASRPTAKKKFISK